MKLPILLALVAGCLSVPIDVRVVNQASQCAQQCVPSNKFRYKPGTTYEFRYEAETTTGIQGASKHHSKIKIDAVASVEIHNPCNFVLRLEKVKLISSDPNNPNNLQYAPGTREFAQALQQFPLKFSFQDGKIENVCPVADEKLWCTNVKRGVLSAFQNSMDSLSKPQEMRESDITGDCHANYEVKSIGYYQTNIKKTKDLLGCTNRQGYNTAIHGIPFTSDSDIHSLPLLKSTHECEQDISTYDGHLKETRCKESHMFRPFSKDESGAVTETKQRLVYQNHHEYIKSMPAIRTVQSSIHFEHANQAGHNTAMRMKESMEKLKDICTSPRDDVRPNTPALFASLVHTLRDLDITALKSLQAYVQGGKLCSSNAERIEKFFMDAIPMVGSSASVQLISEMVSDNQVKDVKANMWLSSLTFIAQPTQDMIKSLQPLLTKRSSTTALLSVSSLINNFCRKNPGSCHNNDDVHALIDLFAMKLGQKCETFHHDKEEVLVTLRALGNAGNALRVVPVLNRCLMNNELPMEARVAVTVAFRHMACEADKNQLMSVYRNENEDSELRIMAYLAVMECPNTYIIKQIQQTLANEHANQVGSFVWSHLTNLMETSNPHKQDIREILENQDLQKEFDIDRRKYSRNYEGSFFLDSLNSGANLESNVIWSSRSFVPRSAMANLTVDLFGHSVNLLEVGGRVEGMENLLEELFGPKGLFRDKKPSRDPAMTHKMKRIDQNFGRKQERLSGSWYLRLFGNELSYLNLDSQTNLASLLDLGRPSKNDKTFHWSQNLMLIDSTLIIPTSVGLPLNLTINATASVDLKVSGHRLSKPKLELMADIQPSGAIQFTTQMSVDAFVTRAGLKMVSTLHTSTKTKLRASLDTKNSDLKFELDTPRDKMEIIDFSTKFFTINHDSEREQDQLMSNNRREQKWCSGDKLTKITGLELCGEVSLPGITVHRRSPFFPLTGPVSMGLSLHNRDTHTKYTFVTNVKESRDAVSFKTAFDTPGSRVDRHVELNMAVNKDKNGIDVNLISPWKTASVAGVLTNKRNLKRFKGDMVIDQSKRYGFMAEVQIDEKGRSIKYIPTIQVDIHGQKSWAIRGQYEQDNKIMAVDVNSDFYEDHPLSFKAAMKSTKKEKSMSGHVQLGKSSIYSVDSKFEHTKRGALQQYKPTLKIQTPTGQLINLDSSLTYKPSKSVSVKFNLDKVFRKPVNIETEFRIAEAKTRTRYLASMEVDSQVIDMKLTSNVDRRTSRGITASRVKVSYNIPRNTYMLPKGSKDSITLTSKLRDRSTDRMARYKFTTSANMVKNPQNNFRLDHGFTWQTKNMDTSIDVRYGDNFRNKDKRIRLSKSVMFVSTPRKTVLEYDLQARYLAMDIDSQLKGNHLHTDTKLSSTSSLKINPKRVYTVNLKLEDPSRRIWQRNAFLSVTNTERTVRFSSELTHINDRDYSNNLNFEWAKNKKANIQTTLKMPTDRRYDVISTIAVTKRPAVTVESSVNLDPMDLKAEVDLKRAASRYGFLISSQIPESGYKGRLDLNHPERRVYGEVNADWSSKYTSDVLLEWDSLRDTNARMSASADVDINNMKDMKSDFNLQYMKENVTLSLKHNNRQSQYTSELNLDYAPYRTIFFRSTFDKTQQWYNTMRSANIIFKSPCQYVRKIDFDTKFHSTRQAYENTMKLVLNQYNPIESSIKLQRPYGLKDLKANMTLTWDDDGLMKANIHHKISNEIHTKLNGEISHNHETKFVDLAVNGKDKGNRRNTDVSGDVTFKSSIDGLQNIELSASHSSNGRSIKSVSDASLGPLGQYKYDFTMNNYQYRSRITNNGRLTVNTPFNNYRSLSADWSHKNFDNSIESKANTRINNNPAYSYDLNGKVTMSDYKSELSGSLTVKTPMDKLKEISMETEQMYDSYNNIIKSSFTNIHNRLNKVAYDFNLRSRDYDITTDLKVELPQRHPFTTKLTTKLSSQPKTINAEVQWRHNEKMTVDSTVNLALPEFLEGTIEFTSPFTDYERVIANVHHTKDRGEWQSTGSVQSPKGKINVISALKLDQEPKVKFEITTPHQDMQLLRLTFSHEGTLPSIVNTKATITMLPHLGDITTVSSYEHGRELKFRIDTPFDNHRYSQASITYSDDSTKSVDARIEYRPYKVIRVLTNFRLDDPRDMFTSLTLTTPCTKVPYFKVQLSHRGDLNRFQCHGSYEFPQRKTSEVNINFSQVGKLEGSVALKTPHEGLEDWKVKFDVNGSPQNFRSHAEISNDNVAVAENDIAFTRTVRRRIPTIDLTTKLRIPQVMEDVFVKVQHNGAANDFKTEWSSNYGERESMSGDVALSVTNDITASATINAASVRVPFRVTAVTFTHKGKRNDFKSELHANYDAKRVDITTVFDIKKDIDLSLTIDTPLEKLKNIELGFHHDIKNRRYVTEADSVTTIQIPYLTEGKKITATTNMKYNPNRKLEVSLDLKTPYTSYEDLSTGLKIRVSQDTNVLDVKSHVQYKTGAKLSFEGNLNVKSGIKTSATILTPFDNHREMSAEVKVRPSSQFEGHVKYTDESRINFSGSVAYDSVKLNVETPYTNYEDLSTAVNVDYTDSYYKVDGHLQYASARRIDVKYNMEPFRVLEIDIKTPFKKYEELSAAYKLDGSNKKYEMNAHIQHATGKRCDLKIKSDCGERLEVDITTPFKNHESMTALFTFNGELKNFKSDGHVEYMTGKRITFASNVKLPSRVAVTFRTPFFKYEDLSLAMNIDHRPETSYQNVVSHVQYASGKRIELNYEMKNGQDVEITFRSPFRKIRDLGFKGNFLQNDNGIKSSGHVQYDTNKRIHLNAEMDIPNKFDIVLRSPFTGYETVSTSGNHIQNNGRRETTLNVQYSTGQNIRLVSMINTNNGFVSTIQVTTPFDGYEDLSAAAKLSSGDRIYNGNTHVKYTNYKKISAEFDADLTRGIRGKVVLKTPFKGVEVVEVVSDVEGTPNIFSGKVHVQYPSLKRIELSGKVDLTKKTEGSVKLTTPFKGYEEMSASADVDGRPDKFRVLADVEYKKGKKIDFKTKVNLMGEFDVSVSLRTPFRKLEDLAVDTTIRGDYKNYDATAAVQYARNKRISIRHKLNLENKPSNFYVLLTTPFKKMESNQMSLSWSGKPSKFSTSTNIESSYLKSMNLEVAHEFSHINSMHSSLSLTTGIPALTDLKFSVINNNQQQGLTAHRAKLMWNQYKTVSVESVLKQENNWYSGSKEIAHIFSVSTPWDKVKKLSSNTEYGYTKDNYFGKMETNLNNKKIVDIDSRYTPKKVDIIVTHPHPMRLTVNTEYDDKVKNADVFVNWNTDKYDSNVRVKAGMEDNSNYYTTKKEYSLAIINPLHKLSLNTEHDYSSRHLTSASRASYNDKTINYDLKLYDRSRPYSRTYNYDGSLSIGSPLRTVDLSGSHTKTSVLQKNQLTVAWDARRDSRKKVILGSEVKSTPNDFEGDFSVQLPHINKEMGLKSKVTLNNAHVWMDGKVDLSYDRDTRKTLTLTSRLEDLARGYGNGNYSFQAGIRHPITETDVKLQTHLGDDMNRLSAGVALEYRLSNRTAVNMALRSEIDRLRKKIALTLDTPITSTTLTGQNRDHDYLLDYISSMRTYTNVYVSQSKLSVDPAARKLVLSTNYNHNRPGEMIQLQAVLDDPRQVSFRVWHNDQNRKVDDASMTLTLNSTRLLHTGIHWRPEIVNEIKNAIETKMEEYQDSASDNILWSMELMADVAVKKVAEIRDSIKRDLKPVLRRLSEESDIIARDLEYISEKLETMYEDNDFHMKTVAEQLKALKNTAESMMVAPEVVMDIATFIVLSPYVTAVHGVERILPTIEELLNVFRDLFPDIVEPVKKVLRSNINKILKTIDDNQHHIDRVVKVLTEPTKTLTKQATTYLNKQSRVLGKNLADMYSGAMYNARDIISNRLTALRRDRNLAYVSDISSSLYNQGNSVIKYMNMKQKIQDMVKARYGEVMSIVRNRLNNLKATLLNLDKTRMIVYDPEHGQIQFEVYLPVSVRSLQKLPEVNVRRYIRNLRNTARSYLPKYWSPWDLYYMYRPASWNPISWIPPFTAHAIQAGKQHFITFDGRHYDFAGVCSYVLARDFVGGDFTVLMNYAPDRWNVRKKSVTVFVGHREIEIFTNYQVTVDRRPVEMPVKVDSAWIKREGGSIIVTSSNGYKVDCDIQHDMYTVSISGWYFGKTAGLFGTYNNEPNDDFIDSHKNRLTDTSRFANSWEVGRSCGSTRNFATQVRPTTAAPGLKECRTMFTSMWSPLRNCFKQIETTPYIEKCLEDHRFAPSQEEANICNSTMLYAHKCSKAGIQISQPKQCEMCDQSEMKTLKKEDGNVPRSADVIFVIQESPCMKTPSQKLNLLATAIDRQFRIKGFRDVRYGLVGFGGHQQDPHSHTLKGQLTNDARTFAASVRFLKLDQATDKTDVYSAVKFAASYPFRAGVSKSIVLLTCDDCEQSQLSLSTVEAFLKEHGVVMTLLKEKDFDSRSNTVPIVASIEDKSRNADMCSRLAESTTGKAFDITPLSRGHSMLRKAVLVNIAKNVVETGEPCSCQNCHCAEGRTVCKPCTVPTSSRIYTYLTNWNNNSDQTLLIKPKTM